MINEIAINVEFNPETGREKVSAGLKMMAEQVNRELGQYGLKAGDVLVDQDGRLIMRSFEKVKDGPYHKDKDNRQNNNHYKDREATSIKEDEKEVGYLEAKWQKSGQNNKETGEGALLEQLIAVLLYKFLPKQFLVVRSAKFDDYENGVDTIIINIKDGSVVAAFDEVVDNPQGERAREKFAKLTKLTEHGGIQIKYGLTFEKDSATGENKLIKKGLNNVPVFYLPFPRERLDEVMAKMSADLSAEPTAAERKMYEDVLDILQVQVDNLINDPRVNYRVLENLKSFADSLAIMKKADLAA